MMFFTVISSANLNTRSMQVDTELGIFTENGAVGAKNWRKDLVETAYTQSAQSQ